MTDDKKPEPNLRALAQDVTNLAGYDGPTVIVPAHKLTALLDAIFRTEPSDD